MSYKDYLKSKDWELKRNEKLKRNSRCGICNDNIVDIHHLNYRNLIDVEQSDLRRLCRRCHFLAHRLFKEGKIVFKNNNHLSQWALLKHGVKKELGITTKNMFYA